jgi:hypothetical protein
MIPYIEEETLLDQFVRSCLFIHDDWIPAAGRADWGAYDTNPFLLGAQVCVVTTLDGFGEDYLDYLKSLNSLPEHIIIPKRCGDNLTLNLLEDEEALSCLRELVFERQLDISVFYHDNERGLDRLAGALSTPDHSPMIYPIKTSFDRVNRKIDGLKYVSEAGVPTPEHAICASIDDVLAFYHDRNRSYPGVVIKTDHRKFVRAITEAQIRQAAAQFTYPLLVETLYDVRVSPSLNMVQWQGEQSSFAVTDQILNHWTHYGNAIPSEVSPEMVRRMRDYTARIGDAIPDLQGVYGVDYIVTEGDELYAVDINPRFCSGTYPQQFLCRMGISLYESYTRYRLVQCSIDSLSTILCDPDFAPLTLGATEGIFIYDPVVYETEKPVNYFSYVAVAQTRERMAMLEETLDAILAKHAPA